MNPSGEANDLFDHSVHWFPPFTGIPLSTLLKINTSELHGMHMDSFSLWVRYLKAKSARLTNGRVLSNKAVIANLNIGRMPGFMIACEGDDSFTAMNLPRRERNEGANRSRLSRWTLARSQSRLSEAQVNQARHLEIGGLCYGHFSYDLSGGGTASCVAIFEHGMLPRAERFSVDSTQWEDVEPRKWGEFTIVSVEWPDPTLPGQNGRDTLNVVTAWHLVE